MYTFVYTSAVALKFSGIIQVKGGRNMNRLGFNLYLKTLVTPSDSLIFLETQEGNFYLDTDKKAWLNYAFRDINTTKEAFGTWKITLNDAEIIDNALNSGLFLLVERRKSERYQKHVLFDGYKLYGFRVINEGLKTIIMRRWLYDSFFERE